MGYTAWLAKFLIFAKYNFKRPANHIQAMHRIYDRSCDMSQRQLSFCNSPRNTNNFTTRLHARRSGRCLIIIRWCPVSVHSDSHKATRNSAATKAALSCSHWIFFFLYFQKLPWILMISVDGWKFHSSSNKLCEKCLYPFSCLLRLLSCHNS